MEKLSLIFEVETKGRDKKEGVMWSTEKRARRMRENNLVCAEF